MLIRPATKKFYLVAGRTVLIEVFDEWAERAVTETFSGWFFKVIPPDLDHPPNSTIGIHCRSALPEVPEHLPSFDVTAGGRCFTDETNYYIRFDNALVRFGDHISQVDLWLQQRYESSSTVFVQLLSQALSPALRRCGVFEIHSAGVIPPRADAAIMIAGPSGCGKSTITTQLAKSGWDYLSDDILLLTESGEEVKLQAFRRFFALSCDTLTAVSLGGIKPGEGSHLKQRLIPQDHFQRDPIEQARPGAIVFPIVSRQHQSQLKLLTPGETMKRLLRLCPWASYDKPTSFDHLRLLGKLANTASGYDFSSGADILDDPSVLTQLFYNIADRAVLAH